MKLEVGHIFINDIQFASESKIENGVRNQYGGCVGAYAFFKILGCNQ